MQVTMAVPYDHWHFLYPPRPENAILPSLIDSKEALGWASSYKLNGTCSLIGVGPEGDFHALTRHNTPHKMWKPTARTRALADFCPRKSWSVFIAELLNDKTPGIKDTLYIFDMVVFDSMQLLGTTFQERQDFLSELLLPKGVQNDSAAWWEKVPDKSHVVIGPGLWLARTQRSGLRDIFSMIRDSKDPAIEGLVLKNPNGKLEMMSRAGRNQAWQCKCRVANLKGVWGF